MELPEEDLPDQTRQTQAYRLRRVLEAHIRPPAEAGVTRQVGDPDADLEHGLQRFQPLAARRIEQQDAALSLASRTCVATVRRLTRSMSPCAAKTRIIGPSSPTT